MIELPTRLDYPLVAIGDLHGQRDELERLLAALGTDPEWPSFGLVFLGDFVDRGSDVAGTIDLVQALLARPAGGSAVMGNHDHALVRAARLDDGPDSPYWVERYQVFYDHEATFRAYLGRPAATDAEGWRHDLDQLRQAMPAGHRSFLVNLPWVVEAPGHLFLHCGLARDLAADPVAQVAAAHARRWDRTELIPTPETNTARLWEPEYPGWLGADRSLSAHPQPYPGKVQVTGHDCVREPDANGTRIRIDTSGGRGRLTACLLRSATATPEFRFSR